MFIVSLKAKLSLAFASFCLLILISLSLTLFENTRIKQAVEVNNAETIPVAFAGAQLASKVNASMAALRGWVLTNTETFKSDRAALWVDIQKQITIIDQLNVPDPAQWQKIKQSLIAFKDSQNRVEAIAHSPEDEPATQLLNERVTPLTDNMLSHVSQAYIEEISLPATPQRKQMLAQMGDIRGAIAVVIGNVRAYLLTGQQHYAKQYQAVWNWALGQLEQLLANRAQLSESQQTEIDALEKAAQKVTPLFAQLVTLRSGEDWNRSRALLIREVTPLATNLLDELNTPNTGLLAKTRLNMEQSGLNTMSAIAELTTSTYILAGLALLLSILAITLSNRTVIAPVRHMTTLMSKLAQGDLRVTIPNQDRKDEIGEMAQAIHVFKLNGEERQRLEEKQTQDRQKREARAQRIEQLSTDFDSSIRRLLQDTTATTLQMQNAARAMNDMAEQTLEQTRSAHSASQQTQDSVQHVASSTGHLSTSLHSVAQNASQSAAAIDLAIDKGENASQTIHWMSEASAHIGEVVQMIDGIAAKTNLLALNATVEASRAGAAGKGFSVVANEVKNLANQTARATHEISEHIMNMQGRTKKSVEAIRDVCSTIAEVGVQASSVRDTVDQQSAATQDISNNVHNVAQNSSIINDSINQVEHAAAQTTSTATQVLNAVDHVSQQADDLKQEVEKFLNALKNA